MSIRVLGQQHETRAWLQVQASGLDAEAAHVPQPNVRVRSHSATTALPVGSSDLSKMTSTLSAANPTSLSMQIFKDEVARLSEGSIGVAVSAGAPRGLKEWAKIADMLSATM